MTELTEQKCLACEGGVELLSFEEIWNLQSSTPKWSVLNKCIQRSFEFDNFAKAFEFVNNVGAVAEEEGHHPDIEFGWGYAQITLLTHAIDGLSINDFIVAAKIDRLLK